MTLFLFVASQIVWAADIRIIGRHADAAFLKNVVKTRLLTNPYYRNKKLRSIDVRVVKKGDSRYLVSYMKGRDTWSFETSVLTLKNNNIVSRVETNTPLTRVRDLVRIPGVIVSLCLDKNVDFVFATPEDGIPSAVEAVEQACISAENAGWSCRTLIGSEATIGAYKAYLTFCPKIKGFGNIGHGNTSGILLYNSQVLDHNWFTALSDTTINGIVTYFNSCNVHNNPLGSCF